MWERMYYINRKKDIVKQNFKTIEWMWLFFRKCTKQLKAFMQGKQCQGVILAVKSMFHGILFHMKATEL
mgnify:CR=1 FL=1